MISQEGNMSCAAACIKQLAKDSGLIIEEKIIRESAGTDKILGTTDLGIILGLEDTFKGKEIISKTYLEIVKTLFLKLLKIFVQKESGLLVFILQAVQNTQ